MFLNNGNFFVKYDGIGIKFEIINVEIGNLCNKLICVVDNEKFFFKYNFSKIYKLEDL